MLETTLPFWPHAQVIGVLAGVVALGGSYGDYRVVHVPSNTDSLAHVQYVMDISDGDTFTLENKDKVRLAEVNAPEKGECYHEEAEKELLRMTEGVGLVLVKDAKATDNFDRLLRWVYLTNGDERADQELLNAHMVREGFARLSPYGNKLHAREMEIAESDAKRKMRGLWGECTEDKDVQQNVRIQTERKNGEAQKNGEYSLSGQGIKNIQNRENCIIKGNVSQNAYGKNYFLPTCRSYGGIKIQEEDGDAWFCTEAEAKKAGFVKSRNCFPRPVM